MCSVACLGDSPGHLVSRSESQEDLGILGYCNKVLKRIVGQTTVVVTRNILLKVNSFGLRNIPSELYLLVMLSNKIQQYDLLSSRHQPLWAKWPHQADSYWHHRCGNACSRWSWVGAYLKGTMWPEVELQLQSTYDKLISILKHQGNFYNMCYISNHDSLLSQKAKVEGGTGSLRY